MITISVIIATYNRAPLLQKQLFALQRQDFKQEDFELIIVDDGSTDHTSEVVGAMQKSIANLTQTRESGSCSSSKLCSKCRKGQCYCIY
jgi:glycosyltransferase involved in cell wall biosynthesis